MKVKLFDKNSVDAIEWPEDEFSKYVKAYFVPLVNNCSSKYIANVNTEIIFIQVGALILPATVNSQEYDNSFVCSIYSHYISYGQYELINFKSKVLRLILKSMLSLFGFGFRLGKINRVVCVNNWLLTTNLYPDITSIQIEMITSHLKKVYPKHAIVFRSLNRLTTNKLITIAESCEYHLMGARQVYILQDATLDHLKKQQRRRLKKDNELINHHQYHVRFQDKMSDLEAERIQVLYHFLYIEKYSPLNPQFTTDFFKLVTSSGFMKLYAIKKDKEARAILGYYAFNNIMTTPVFGYDINLDKQEGLYRVLNSVTMQLAEQNGYIDHASSGAAEFKRGRGYQAAIEYNAVYFQHLSWVRRFTWIFLKFIANQVAVPIIRKLKL